MHNINHTNMLAKELAMQVLAQTAELPEEIWDGTLSGERIERDPAKRRAAIISLTEGGYITRDAATGPKSYVVTDKALNEIKADDYVGTIRIGNRNGPVLAVWIDLGVLKQIILDLQEGAAVIKEGSEPGEYVVMKKAEAAPQKEKDFDKFVIRHIKSLATQLTDLSVTAAENLSLGQTVAQGLLDTDEQIFRVLVEESIYLARKELEKCKRRVDSLVAFEDSMVQRGGAEKFIDLCLVEFEGGKH